MKYVVEIQTSLPNSVVKANIINTFKSSAFMDPLVKNRLDEHWSNQFNFTARCSTA